MLTAISAQQSQICYFYEFDFATPEDPSAPVDNILRFTSSTADIAWNGYSWLGIGGVLEFDAPNETGDLNAAQVTIKISGVDLTVMAILLSSYYVGRLAKIYLAHLDMTTLALISDPVLLFQGLMNGGFEIQEKRPASSVTSVPTCDISMKTIDRIGDLDVRRGIQTNTTSLTSFYPGDKFFEFVPGLVDRAIVWGTTTP